MRAVRLLSSFAVAGVLILGGSAAGAQTTTVPPVRSIPVTGGTAATTTTAPASTAGGAGATTAGTATDSTGATGGLADTGLAADLLVPFALALIGGGAVMQVVARRRGTVDYGLL